jgi:hypothetical protein
MADWPVTRLFHVLIGGHKADPSVLPDLAAMPVLAQAWRGVRRNFPLNASRSGLLAPLLNRGAKPNCLAIFGHRAAGQFKAFSFSRSTSVSSDRIFWDPHCRSIA